MPELQDGQHQWGHVTSQSQLTRVVLTDNLNTAEILAEFCTHLKGCGYEDVDDEFGDSDHLRGRIAQLVDDRDSLQSQLDVLGQVRQKLIVQVETLTKERDEARDYRCTCCPTS